MRVLSFLWACLVWVLGKLDNLQHWLAPNAVGEANALCRAFMRSVDYFHEHFCRDCREEEQ